MGFLPYDYEIVDAAPPKPSTKKKRWNAEKQTWEDISIWRISNHNREIAEWLTENHGGPNYNFNTNYEGWTIIAGYIWMSEPIYLFYALKFGNAWD